MLRGLAGNKSSKEAKPRCLLRHHPTTHKPLENIDNSYLFTHTPPKTNLWIAALYLFIPLLWRIKE
jgi:hypothetical protein